MPRQSTELAGEIDTTFYFIYWVCIVFFILLMGAMILFTIQYKKQSDSDRTLDLKGSHTIEFIWSVFPTFLLLAMFVMGFKTYIKSTVPPADSMEVRITAYQWGWKYYYSEYGVSVGARDALVVPEKTAVRLRMTSDDVLHSFYVPDFRMKKDVVPNRYTMQWFETTGIYEGQAYMQDEVRRTDDSILNIKPCKSGEANCDGHAEATLKVVKERAAKEGVKLEGELKAGVHQVFCTEYCGDDHSRMLSKIVVLKDEHFKLWMNAQVDFSPYAAYKGADGKPDMAKVGEYVSKKLGCTGCHTVDGSDNGYPTWKGLYGADRAFTDGSSAKADENYLRESVLQPQSKIVAAYAQKKMNSGWESQFKDERDLDAIITYIKSLK